MKTIIYRAGPIDDLNFFWSVQHVRRKLGADADIGVVVGTDEFAACASSIPLQYLPLLATPGPSDLIMVVGQDFELGERYFELARFDHEEAFFYSIASDDEIGKSKARAFALGLKVDLDNIRFSERPVSEDNDNLLFLNDDPPGQPPDVRGILIYGEDIPAIQRSVDNLKMVLPETDVGVLTNSKTFRQLDSMANRADVFRYSEVDINFLVDRYQALIDLNADGGGTQRRTLIRIFAGDGARVYSSLEDLPAWKNATPISGSVADLIHPIAMQLSQTGRHFLPGTSEAERGHEPGPRMMPSIGNAAIDDRMNIAVDGIGDRTPPAVSDLGSGIAYLAINGNGLGHAQRVANIAALVGPQFDQKIFCFNSCVPFLTERGFDVTPLVSRPVGKVDSNIELLNFGRLASGTAGYDRFVFDGGYPYDSVVSFLQRFSGRRIWVRRGLWKAVQDNSEPRARAKFFDLLIRPGEFFEELNGGDESFRKEVNVGPIVNLTYEQERNTQAQSADRPGRIKILSMLGSGFIKDRNDILQAICQYCERRSDVRHVSVVWPQTRLDAGATNYRNTTFVSTNDGTRLILDSDIVITAAGYNTFGDCIYYRKPAIFLPQQADWLDDQALRAEAARSRGLAECVEDGDVLSLLKAIGSFCDKGTEEYTKAFRDLELPEPGNREIAGIITEEACGAQ
jgi:hypothetical protein